MQIYPYDFSLEPEFRSSGEYAHLSGRCHPFWWTQNNKPYYSPQVCHDYAADCFNAHVMAIEYLKQYEQVLNGKTLEMIPAVLRKNKNRESNESV